MSSSSKWNDLAVRTASALLIAPVVIVLAWAGGVWFAALLAIAGACLAFEWCRLVYGADERPQLVVHSAGAVAGVLVAAAGQPVLGLGAVGVFWLLSVFLLIRRRPQTGAAWIGVGYVALPVLALYLVRSDANEGLGALIWLMVLVWSADTVAYVVGRMIGGPKLAPRISPGKTWSGLGGAVLGGAMASGVAGHLLEVDSAFLLSLLGGILAVIAQCGDLFESHLKRRAGVKDSGKLIPGHGGIFDRVDGLVAVALAALMIGLIRGGEFAAIAGNLLNW